MMRTIVAVFAVAAFAAIAVPARSAPAATPLPVTAPIPSGPAGFYIVQGPVILSPAYPNGAECIKALAKIKKDIAPGKDTLACAHRHP